MRTIDLTTDQPGAFYLDVRYDPRLPKPDQFTLLENLTIRLPDGRVCRLPAGMVSDGASVPGWLWSLCPAIDNRVLLAYVLHDYLYEFWEEFDAEGAIGGPQRYADRLMYAVMRQMAPRRWARNWAYFAAVWVFGRFNWTKYRNPNQTSIHDATNPETTN